MSIVPLSEDQKRTLLDLSQKGPELLVHRARLILAYASGKATLQAANEAGISRGRARYWKRQFMVRGMGIFNLDAVTSIPGEPPAGSAQPSQAGMQSASSHTQEGGSELRSEIPLPKPMQSIGILPDDSLAEAGRKVWLYHFALMLCHEQGTLLGDDTEELHDMRVATRRMRTAFDVFSPAFDPKMLKHYLKGLRAIGRDLGAVRDMDVLLEYALAYQKNLSEEHRPGLEPLLSAWQHAITKKRSRMIRHLQSEDYQDFKSRFNLFLQPPEQVKPLYENLVMNSRLRDIVPVLVYERYAAVRAFEAIIATASITQLHAIRIEFKKFRYVLEYFREILGEVASKAIAELKQIQDHLGELHDADVACGLVNDFLERWEKEQSYKPIRQRENPEPIVTYLAYLHAKRYRLMTSFLEQWAKFNQPEFRQYIAQAISSL
jgi:CHAD domain-containing protein